MTDRRARSTTLLLSVAHLVTDAYSSFLLPLLPMLTLRLKLTPVQAGMLIPTMMIASSLMQPVYGMISDRYFKRSMSVYGPLVAAVCLSMIGLVDSLGGLLACIVLGGIGIGSFHPQSAAIVSNATERARATTMSIFSSAGTVGVALGPVLITTIIAIFGFERSYVAVVPGVIMWMFLLKYCPPLESSGHADAQPLHHTIKAVLAPLVALYFAVVLRSAVHVSIQTYMPFLLNERGMSLTGIGWVLSGFIFFGGVGGLFGGTLADRWGSRRVSMISLALSVPLLAGALTMNGSFSYVLLAIGGTFLNVGVPVNVVMAQRLVPGGASTVSALMMGFAWGAGALCAPLAGVLSTSVGFARALTFVSVLPLFAVLLLTRFPKDDKHGVHALASEAT